MLRRIDQGQGHEALYRDQQPQLLRGLEQSTRIESITASNAIENINVDPDRAERIVQAKSAVRFRGRNEEEFAGYRDAIDELVVGNGGERPTIPWMLHIHRTLYKYSGGGGGILKIDSNEIVEYVDGVRHVIFRSADPAETHWLLSELFERFDDACERQLAHPLLLIGAFTVDLLAIHPVADGNGRLSRLVTMHLLLRSGYDVSRYVSIEQRIHDTKGDYYAALRASQKHWHEDRHDVWPFIEYLCRILASAYDVFEQRMAAAGTPSGTKQDQVRDYVVNRAAAEFKIREVERALPGISTPTIRLVLRELRDSGRISVTGSGPTATWMRREPAARPDEGSLF